MPGTRCINYRELSQQYRLLGPQRMQKHLIESLDKGDLKPSDFSIRELAENSVENGREWVETMDPRKKGSYHLLEASAVETSTFSNITGQIVYSRLIEDMMDEEYRFTALIPTQSTPFDGEKIAGISKLDDSAEAILEADEYPMVGVTEDWIETPVTTKRGMIVPVTKEAIFFDRTSQLLAKAGGVGQALGLNKEKRAIDCVIDENTTAHRYKWRGTMYATYQTTTPWDNVTASNALVDWTDIDNAEQTLNGILDPNTGEPVVVEATHIIVTKQLEKTAMYIRSSTESRIQVGGFATSGNLTSMNFPTPLKPFEIVSSRQLAARAATDTTWLYGNPTKAFVYMENWPITVVQAPTNSEDDFKRDIVTQYKASERGAYATINPRFMTECTV